MNSFYVINGKKLKRVFFLIVAALFAAGVVYVESDNIMVFSEGSNPAAIYSVPTDKKIIALTFDISWGDKRAEPILNLLQENGVKKATFFISAPWAKTHPNVVKKIVEAGYEIGSHGHKHDNYSSLNDEEIRKQITIAHQVIKDVSGKEPHLIRMPNGDFDKRVLQIANELNYKVIQWDTDSMDWKNIGVDQIVKRVKERAHPGDIVLLHASDNSKQTHLALPTIIEDLRQKGYEFVSVSELINQTEVNGKTLQDKTTIQQHLHDAGGM